MLNITTNDEFERNLAILASCFRTKLSKKSILHVTFKTYWKKQTSNYLAIESLRNYCLKGHFHNKLQYETFWSQKKQGNWSSWRYHGTHASHEKLHVWLLSLINEKIINEREFSILYLRRRLMRRPHEPIASSWKFFQSRSRNHFRSVIRYLSSIKSISTFPWLALRLVSPHYNQNGSAGRASRAAG